LKKITNLNIFKKILANKQEKTSFVDEKQTKSKHSLISPDNDIVNVIDTPFIVLKHNNKIHFINTAAKITFNLSSEDNIFHTFRTPEFHENISKIKDKKISKSQFTLKLFNVPQTKFFNVKMFRLADNNTLLSFIDITRLQHLENLRTDFVGNVSHELKTPLSTIINIIELLENQKKITVKEKNKFMKILSKESLKMKSIIENLLHLTKIETDFTKKITKVVNLNKIILDSISRTETRAKKNGIKIKYTRSKPVNILGDSDQLQQMFVNIIDNSIKYADKKSLINIELRNFENKLILSFRDQGKGIPQRLIPRITERFYRTPEAKVKRIEGTGLGLAIVKHIAIMHKAKLRITSKINIGTTIEVSFKKV
jgi:two-component system phosphate regulon sensor histidine kinase PhoR